MGRRFAGGAPEVGGTQYTLDMSVIVIHSDPLFGSAIGSLVEREGGFSLLLVSSDARTALERAESEGARVLLLDVQTADSVSPADLRALKAKGCRVAVICSEQTISTRAAAVADAVLNTQDGPEVLFERLGELGARRKGLYVAEDAAAYLGVRLSKREQSAASYVAKGMSNRDIAEAMQVTEQSVKNYLRRLMRKLDCKNRVQLLLKLSGQKVG